MIMYSVLLIDDESWVMEDLKLLVDWECLGFKVVAGANNAEAARIAIDKFNPDLVVSDIRMPGLSGIQLLEEYADVKHSFKTVFVTAYGKFEYAKKALELGAFGYLLKPVEPNELKMLLIRIKDALDKEKNEYKKIYNYEKSRILYSLLEDYTTDEETKMQLHKIGINNVDENYVVVIIKSENDIQLENLDMSEWNTLTLSISNRRCMFVVQSKKTNMNLVSYKNLLKHLNHLAEENNLVMGVSRITHGIRRFRTAFSRAEIALGTFFINKKPLNVYTDTAKKVKDISTFISNYKANHSINELFKQLPEVLCENKVNIEDFQQIMNYLNEQINIESSDDGFDVVELINQFPDIESYFDYLYQYVTANYKKVNGKTSSRHIIKEITDYIKYNYNQKLMINDLAQKFYLNPSYLSGLFKEETGKPFTAYLVECRLNKAIELLENTELSSSEISASVGYEDYFHFSKLFKKHIGISPSNYRKSKKDKDEE